LAETNPNMVVIIALQSKLDEVTASFRRLFSEELHFYLAVSLRSVSGQLLSSRHGLRHTVTRTTFPVVGGNST